MKLRIMEEYSPVEGRRRYFIQKRICGIWFKVYSTDYEHTIYDKFKSLKRTGIAKSRKVIEELKI